MVQVTPIQAILSRFPGAPLQYSGYCWKVSELYGNQVDDDNLRAVVAKAISQALLKHRQPSEAEEEALASVSKKLGIPYGSRVVPERVRLYQPESGLLELWPLSLVCRNNNCRAYHLLDGRSLPLAKCRECGGDKFDQLGIVHVCLSCSKIQPLRPPYKLAKRNPDGTFICKNCGVGRIGLEVRRAKLSESRWFCKNCGEHEGPHMGCGCHPGGNAGVTGNQKMQQMSLKTVSVNPLKPAIVSAVSIEGRNVEDVAKDILEGRRKAIRRGTDVLKNQDAAQYIRALDIDPDNIYLVRNVKAALACYGYYTKKGADIQPWVERDVNFRKHYRAYVAIAEGEAVLLKVRVSLGIGEDKFTYLHTLEHALTKSFHLLAGVESGSFIGKVLDELDAVLIYECSEDDKGSLSYAFNHKLSEVFAEAVRMLMSCKYDCRNACVGCIYVKDPLCHPTSGYFMPNDRLDRKLVLRQWGIKT